MTGKIGMQRRNGLFQSPGPLRLMPGLLALLLSACAGADRADGPATAPPPAPDATAEGDTDLLNRLGALERQQLNEGRCGMFLWAAMPTRKLVFFTESENAAAHMVLDGKTRALPRDKASGDPVFGLFPHQRYTHERTVITVDVTPEPRQDLKDGAVIRRGTLRLRERGGWEAVLPVAGMIGCR
ncbi:hypothetical protein [Yunchengibacter salinarum]|uniref:hypothetical protein n=1 Tax=Yunchengibacter salinarum TaxID=3133399 RepID=UPI0035B5F5A3